MKRITEWSNVPGCVCVEVECDEGNPDSYITMDGKPLPEDINDIIGVLMWNHSFNKKESWVAGCIIINFLSSGYDDPGILTGPIETSYPPESDDERLIDSIDLEIYPAAEISSKPVTLKDIIPVAQFAAFEDAYSEEIRTADLEEQDPGDDDSDWRREDR